MNDYSSVTELANDEVSHEQVERLAHRYNWASSYCPGKDVLEIACGAGQGLGFLVGIARSLSAGDITSTLVDRARAHYAGRMPIEIMDAMQLPVPPGSVDVVILFEAIYYLPSAEKFLAECRRVLRPGGAVLIATANKDLYDFNPSPLSTQYFGVPELDYLLGRQGFTGRFFGAYPVSSVSVRQKILRPLKTLAVKLNLMPKTMAGKKWLKRLVFGDLTRMPPEIDPRQYAYLPPVEIPSRDVDRHYKVIYCAASLNP